MDPPKGGLALRGISGKAGAQTSAKLSPKPKKTVRLAGARPPADQPSTDATHEEGQRARFGNCGRRVTSGKYGKADESCISVEASEPHRKIVPVWDP